MKLDAEQKPLRQDGDKQGKRVCTILFEQAMRCAMGGRPRTQRHTQAAMWRDDASSHHPGVGTNSLTSMLEASQETRQAVNAATVRQAVLQ